MPVERLKWHPQGCPTPHHKHDSQGKYIPQKGNPELDWEIHKSLEEIEQLRIGDSDTFKLTPLELDIIDGRKRSFN